MEKQQPKKQTKRQLSCSKVHYKKIAEHGEDNVSAKEAYIEVLKTEAGYVKGLGPGPRLPRKGKSGRESDELRELNADISVLKASNKELKASNEELKASNEELKAFNMELKSEINQMRIEAIEKDKRLKEEIKEMLQLIPRQLLRLMLVQVAPLLLIGKEGVVLNAGSLSSSASEQLLMNCDILSFWR